MWNNSIYRISFYPPYKHLVVSEKVYNFEPENEKRHNGVTKDKIEILKIVSKSLLLEILTVFFCM